MPTATAALSSAKPKLLPDDILSAIFTLAKKRSGATRLAFRGHDFKLQQIFYKLSRKHKITLQNYFVFSKTGPVPYSPALNESISRLQLAGLLGRQNPEYEVLFLRDSAEGYYEKVLASRFSPAYRQQLEKVAQSFLELVETC